MKKLNFSLKLYVYDKKVTFPFCLRNLNKLSVIQLILNKKFFYFSDNYIDLIIVLFSEWTNFHCSIKQKIHFTVDFLLFSVFNQTPCFYDLNSLMKMNSIVQYSLQLFVNNCFVLKYIILQYVMFRYTYKASIYIIYIYECASASLGCAYYCRHQKYISSTCSSIRHTNYLYLKKIIFEYLIVYFLHSRKFGIWITVFC